MKIVLNHLITQVPEEGGLLRQTGLEVNITANDREERSRIEEFAQMLREGKPVSIHFHNNQTSFIKYREVQLFCRVEDLAEKRPSSWAERDYKGHVAE